MTDYTELVKQLRELPHLLFVQLGFHENLVYKAADAIEELQRLNAEITRRELRLRMQKPRWIPVTERLPDTMKDKSVYSGWSAEIAPSDDVLCYLPGERRMTVAWYSYTYDDWTTVDENTVYKYGEISHWAELPEPPKEEEA